MPSLSPARSGLLQRKCACGGTPGPEGECAECRRKRLQRQAEPPATPSAVPPAVHETLGSSGQPLDASTRNFMEARFGHDFGRVRVHTDARAAESARAVNAEAYTVGRDVVFGPGWYVPETAAGRELLAHELTHVIQQTVAHGAPVPEAAAEAQARRSGRRIAAGHAPLIDTRVRAGTLQRQEGKNELDEKAKAIIARARDDKTKAEERAVQVVKSIIKEYYPSEEPNVDSVAFNEEKAGTGVHVEEKFAPSSRNEESKGTIYVGSDFLKGVTERHFARRVLQVGHELEHITQWRTGMAGGHKSAEREFLAFYHEALAEEKPGTGRMQRATRVQLIDAALGYYYCLTAQQQKQYASNKKELLDRRPVEVKASGRSLPDPPTECGRQ
jgi:hypothetical protein